MSGIRSVGKGETIQQTAFNRLDVGGGSPCDLGGGRSADCTAISGVSGKTYYGCTGSRGERR